MRIPASLAPLVDYGIIHAVIRPLMSGKEAQVFLVDTRDGVRVAKVYKEATARSFRNRTDYTDGRRVRSSRDQRAMAKHSRHGKAQDEAAWRATEANTIYRLADAGVRVPAPYHFVEGVLVMELVCDSAGNPAPRLGDVDLTQQEARAVFDRLLGQVTAMLCAGIIHGDLSDFNILLAHDGPVIIDFPQAVDAASNQGARRLLLRDVDNLHRFLARHSPGRYRALPYAQEMWDLYQANLLNPDTVLTGQHREGSRSADVGEVLGLLREDRGSQRGGHAGNQHRKPATSGQAAKPSEQGRIVSRSRRIVEVIMTPPPQSNRRQQPAPARNPQSAAAPGRQTQGQAERDGPPKSRHRRRRPRHSTGSRS